MTKTELIETAIGTRLWIFDIVVSRSGKITKNLIAEVEKLDEGRFKVVSVESGTSFRVGNITTYFGGRLWCLFRTRKDGVDYWNSVIYNCVDRLESEYQRKTKALKSKLL